MLLQPLPAPQWNVQQNCNRIAENTVRKSEPILTRVKPAITEIPLNGVPPKYIKPTQNNLSSDNSTKILLITVGLPAHGKSYVSQKLASYFNWIGTKSQVFDMSEFRRAKSSPALDEKSIESNHPRNELLEVILEWFKRDGDLAVLDGSNNTRQAREAILQVIKSHKSIVRVKPIFIEIPSNPELLQSNIAKMALSPTYANFDEDKIVLDVLAKIDKCGRVYEPVEPELRYIKLAGSNVESNRITGHIPTKAFRYLGNLQLQVQPVYLIRHGQSEYNIDERIGGNPGLTSKGLEFANRLSQFMANTFENPSEFVVWTSTMKRAIQTSENINCTEHFRWRALEEIETGICDGMTYEDIKHQMPEEHQARSADKLNYRYPGGESYADLILRLEPVIVALERRTCPVVLVAHQAVLRCIYAYFNPQKSRSDVPFIDFPSSCVVKVVPAPYKTKEERFYL